MYQRIKRFMRTPFSQGDCLSPNLRIVLGNIHCLWEKISTPNYIITSPKLQLILGFIYTFLFNKISKNSKKP